MSEIKYVTPSGLTHYDEKIKEVIDKVDTSTNTKVTQTPTSTDASYPLLLSPSGQTQETNTTSYFNSGVVLNPSTKTISADIDGNAATATNATSANKLNTNAGSATKPTYFENGVPKECTHELNKTVPSDAVFTDTTYSVATTEKDGLMSASDKVHVDKIGDTDISGIGDGTATGAISSINTNSNTNFTRIDEYFCDDEFIGRNIFDAREVNKYSACGTFDNNKKKLSETDASFSIFCDSDPKKFYEKFEEDTQYTISFQNAHSLHNYASGFYVGYTDGTKEWFGTEGYVGKDNLSPRSYYVTAKGKTVEYLNTRTYGGILYLKDFMIEKGDVGVRAYEAPIKSPKALYETINNSISDAWISSVTYAVNDYCIYNNSLWKCLIQNTNVIPVEGTYWTKVTIASELNSKANIGYKKLLTIPKGSIDYQASTTYALSTGKLSDYSSILLVDHNNSYSTVPLPIFENGSKVNVGTGDVEVKYSSDTKIVVSISGESAGDYGLTVYGL